MKSARAMATLGLAAICSVFTMGGLVGCSNDDAIKATAQQRQEAQERAEKAEMQERANGVPAQLDGAQPTVTGASGSGSDRPSLANPGGGQPKK